jgi:hypothetical protein
VTTQTSTRRKKAKAANLTPWLVGLGVVALIAVPTVINVSRSASLPGESFADQGNAHIPEGSPPPAYNSDPPTSGAHWETMANWSSYDFVVPDQMLLHNLEDGGVILWYTLGSPEENRERLGQLEEVARGFQRVVIAPREGLETPFAATAWQRRQLFESVDAAGMRAFIEAFEGVDHHG